jgi:hypothetical protein
MGPAELRDLAGDIKAAGLREPVTLTPDGKLLDGRNRALAFMMAGVEVRTVVYDADPWLFSASKNAHRHLTTDQVAMIVAELVKRGRAAPSPSNEGSAPAAADSTGQAPVPSNEGPGPTVAKAAKTANIPKTAVESALVVLEHGTEQQKAAVRSGEAKVRGEICPGNLWVIPGERMKGGREHTIPLSSIALEVLERQRAVRTGDLIFPGRGGSAMAYSHFALAPKELGVDAGTPHSWRSHFRDWCGDIGRIDRDLAESALAHALGGTEASYRCQTAVEARRPVMQAYADWLVSDGVAAVALRA